MSTGVKGVLADYSRHQESERVAMIARAEAQREMIRMHSITADAAAGEAAAAREREDKLLRDNHGDDIDDHRRRLENEREEQEKDEDVEDLLREDDAEYQRIVRDRVQELTRQLCKPTFGFVAHVAHADFVDAIDKEHADTIVIVHMYENFVPHCHLVNKHLSDLAQAHPHVKFVKAISEDLKPGYDTVLLPTLMVYRNKKLLCSVIRPQDALGATFTSAELFRLLQGYESDK